MAWIVPENKLDDQQRDFIDSVDINLQNRWIKGFPGSGKSVLLAHAIRKIKAKNNGASILVVVFTRSLIKMFEAAFKEMGVHVNVVTYFRFVKSNSMYDYIFSDEVQDLPPSILQAMMQRAKHVVVAGDSYQSIFERDPITRERTVTPTEINELLNSSEFELNIIHRLSRSIKNAVNLLMPQMHIFAAKIDPRNSETQIRLGKANDMDEEVQYIMIEARKAINVRQTVGVLIPTQDLILSFIQSVIRLEGEEEWDVELDNYGNTDYSSLNYYLSSLNIPLQYVGNGHGEFSENSYKINVMTYHSVKGLDFDNVFLPFLNRNLFISPNWTMSKTLFMVALTRCRNNLYITYRGYLHEFVNSFASDCHVFDIRDSLNIQQPKDDGDSPFAGF